MTILEKRDFAEVTLKSLIADYDYETMVNLYQPIVGFTATSLYFTLVAEGKNQRVYSLVKHEEILMKMQISSGAFVDARKHLEAVGLLKTYLLKSNGEAIYHYDIYSPRTPANFFDNALLYGMLIKCVGETSAKKIKDLYPVSSQKDYGNDISAKFTDIFNPKYDDPAFVKALSSDGESIGRNASKIQGNFSYENFFKALSEISQISSEAFVKEEMDELYRLVTLYGINEETAANYVSEVYNPSEVKGRRIDFATITKLFQNEIAYSARRKRYGGKGRNWNKGDTDLASKINLMETVSPKEFLAYLQNGTQPATPDLNLINSISRKFGLPNPVINAVIDFTLAQCQNEFNKFYAEKIAAALSREGIETTIDAMNYLNKEKPYKKSSSPKNNKDKKEEKENPREETNKQDDGPSWDDILDDIDQGGSDGKA